MQLVPLFVPLPLSTLRPRRPRAEAPRTGGPGVCLSRLLVFKFAGFCCAVNDSDGVRATTVQQTKRGMHLLLVRHGQSQNNRIEAEVGAVSEPLYSFRREGGQSLVIGGPSLVISEGKTCNPL